MGTLERFKKNYTLTRKSKVLLEDAHGFEPAKVTTADEPELYKRLYHSSSKPQFRFAVNDTVKITRARDIFRKGYMPGWTEETFRIYKRYPTIPPTYVLQDFNSREIEGRFYNEELQKIDKL
ncbi:chromo domain-containing protein [Trichonephila clavipes]|nr:chromo domain-containing protein [Trichonephila clavipes]